MLALGVVVAGVLLSLYLRYVRYERVAVHHVIPGAIALGRLEVEQAPLYEPVRKHLLPVLGGPAAPPAEGDARLSRIEERTGLRRGDLREIVASRSEPGDWVLVLGGIFPKEGTAVLGAALHAESPEFEASDDGRVVVHRSLGVTVGRAKDGCVVIGSSEAGARAALEPGGAYESFGLATQGVGGLGVTAAALQALEASGTLTSVGIPRGTAASFDRAGGSFSLDERLSLNLWMQDGGGGQGVQKVRAALSSILQIPRSEASPAGALLRAAVERAPPPQPDGRTVRLALVWERTELEEAARLLAEAVRKGSW